MRNIIVAICLLVICINSSCKNLESKPKQNEEQEVCAKERWLSLYKTKNKFLYDMNEDKMDPYQEIKKLLLDGEIRLWTERLNNPEWMTSPLPSMIHDSIPYSGDTLYYNVYFDYKSEGDLTLKTASGADSMYTYPDGTQSYLYPMPKYEPVTLDNISEFRIKEVLVHDSIANKNVMKPSLLGIDVYTDHHTVLFWVRIDDLKDYIKINKDWINKIANSEYNGFIYKQYSCDDPIYEWKKVYH